MSDLPPLNGTTSSERIYGIDAAQVPYFDWVSIATVLQLAITWMNRA